MWETILQGKNFMPKSGGTYFHVGPSKRFTFLHFIQKRKSEVNFPLIFIFCASCKSSEQTKLQCKNVENMIFIFVC